MRGWKSLSNMVAGGIPYQRDTAGNPLPLLAVLYLFLH